MLAYITSHTYCGDSDLLLYTRPYNCASASFVLQFSSYEHWVFFTPPRNRGGIMFSLQFVCVSVCLVVCLCVWLYLWTNSSWTDAPIWTRYSLNRCLQHWFGPYWNWWNLVKGQGHSDSISIFFFIILSVPLFRLTFWDLREMFC